MKEYTLRNIKVWIFQVKKKNPDHIGILALSGEKEFKKEGKKMELKAFENIVYLATRQIQTDNSWITNSWNSVTFSN